MAYRDADQRMWRTEELQPTVAKVEAAEDLATMVTNHAALVL